MKDQIIRAVSMDGFVRIFAAETTALCAEAAKIHGCSAPAAAALGRTLTATAMMGAMMKDEGGSLTVQIDGGGAIGKICAVSDSSAFVRGYCTNPQADAPDRFDGHLNVGGIVGTNGFLSVVRDYGLKEPYTGGVPLVSGEIGEDFTAYFVQSEQTPSAVGLGVFVEKDLSVSAAGGFIIQLMPGADDAVIDDIEQSIKRLGSVTEALRRGMSAEQIAENLLSDHSLLFYEPMDTQFFCPCSKERMKRALYSLKKSDLIDIIQTDGHAELSCRFCGEKHDFSKEDLTAILDERNANG